MLLSEDPERETDPGSPAIRFWHQLKDEPPADSIPFSTGVLITILILLIIGLFAIIWWSGGAILGA